MPHLKTPPAHQLAGAHKLAAHYSSQRAPHRGLARERARLGAPGEGGVQCAFLTILRDVVHVQS
jgi:alpha-D-ribose 1-methylphosphonate 5-triphosphate synthase subunit PhnG